MTEKNIKWKRMREWTKKNVKLFKRDWQLHLCVWIPIIYLLIFDYGPMYGVQIAFRNYTPAKGIVGSDWVGLSWFKQFLDNYKFMSYLKNTIVLSLYSLIAGFPLPIIFALLLNTLRNEKFKKLTQTISYMPHFISMVVFVGILNMVLSPVSGIYGNLYRLFGGSGYPYDFRGAESAFRHLYVWSGIWQNMGWSSIIYISALSAVSQELHEAAQLDGATRLQRIRYVDFPSILPTVAILLIMRCGSIISVGFEKVYLMQNSLNLGTSEVLSTYVYKTGMSSFKNYSYASAVGLFNTAINLTLLVIVNFIVKKMTENEVSLF